MPDTPEEKRFRAEQDVRTLIEAEKIKRDKGRMDASMNMVNEQKKFLDKVTNVRITRPIKTREDVFKGFPIRKKKAKTKVNQKR